MSVDKGFFNLKSLKTIKNRNLKISTKFLPYILVVAIFILASIIYFHPVLKGQKIQQSDITQFKGMVKEINDFRADKNTEPYWTGASLAECRLIKLVPIILMIW